MRVFVIGISGKVGALLADELLAGGDGVGGLVRHEAQGVALAARGADVSVGDLVVLEPGDLASLLDGFDAVVFAAGSNGGARAVTDAVDGEGVEKAMAAARRSGVRRFVLVSVLPESWRERDLDDDVEHYFAVKKRAEVALTRSDLEWLVVRPSLLVDDPPAGTVALGPAQLHGQISRRDVAATVAALLREPGIGTQILELDGGPEPIGAAVAAVARRR